MPKSSSQRKGKWDQVLNPLMAKSGSGAASKKLSRKTSHNRMDETAYYLQQQQQQQLSQSHAINYMNAPNQSTTQCDCGNDDCPFCNLMLNMEMTDPNMLM